MFINTMKDDFLWGCATASYQVEGAFDKDDRGMSIWDTFCREEGKVLYGHNGDNSSNQYYKYKEDVKLMKELGVKSYRFSISWPRIYPKNMDKINFKGFDYYNNLIDELLKNGIKPAVTLYHWDLPQYLQDQGGWNNREIAYAFAKYAKTCFDTLGEKVDMWITLNEPACSAYLGYLHGNHAPGIKDKTQAYNAVHHLNLAHALAVKEFRDARYKGSIGITLNLSKNREATKDLEDIKLADESADMWSRMFTDPLFKGHYPKRFLDKEKITMPIEDGDLKLINQKIDFLGVNYYTEEISGISKNSNKSYRDIDATPDFGWMDTPQGLYRLLLWIKKEYGDIALYITENGCERKDVLNRDESRCHDPSRIKYLRGHFAWAKKAIDEDNVNLKGYFVWSFIDNFEWAFGYTKRFGLVYCDYQDYRRIPKDSYYFYRDVIAGHEDLKV